MGLAAKPDRLPSPHQVAAMTALAKRVADKALVAVLYESGCRVAELLGLRLNQVHRCADGFLITIESMRGARDLALTASARHLAAWLIHHPLRHDPKAPVWLAATRPTKPLTWSDAAMILGKAAHLAGIPQPVRPRDLRHARAVYLAEHLARPQLKRLLGLA